MDPIQLPAKCDRAAADVVHQDFLEAVPNNPLRIDAGKVEHLGHAMLQLLVAAVKSDADVEFTAMSEPFKQSVALAGLEERLVNGADA